MKNPRIKFSVGLSIVCLAMGLAPVLGLPPKALPNVAKATVYISAAASVSPTPRIVLSWKNDTAATGWTLSRRDANAAGGYGSWVVLGNQAIATSPAPLTYTDTTMRRGSAYEYRIVKTAADSGATYEATGFILAGIEEPAIENRGKLVLMVESSLAAALAPELKRLEYDLAGDGWEVLRHDVDKSLAPPQVKAIIKADYDADPSNVKALFLFGSVAQPYSGDYVYTHGDQRGAQPTDLYYGDMNGEWKDEITSRIDGAIGLYHRYRNYPNDGKFDPSTVPGDKIVELEVGRVDLRDMPAFRVSETELLRRYLNKDHHYRHANLIPKKRVLYKDGWGSRYEMLDFWRNYSCLVGFDKIKSGAFLPTLADSDPEVSSYLWCYGGGGGSPVSMLGIPTSVDYANNVMNAVFFSGFGSYWHGWDFQDSLFRAPLAGEGAGLAALFCQGSWFLHDMALGRNIGSALRRSQSLWWDKETHVPIRAHWGGVEQCLMGDPTLRTFYVAPSTRVTAALSGAGVVISWGASSEEVEGYHLYRRDGESGPYKRLDNVGTSDLVSGTTFTDTSPAAGQCFYMVRAIKLENCASGSFQNPSQGITVAHPMKDRSVKIITAGGLPQTSPSRVLKPSGSYQKFTVPPETKPAGAFVCTWTGTGSVPSSGRGTTISVWLDQDSSIEWTWAANQDSVATFYWPEQGKSYGSYEGQPNILPIEVGVSDPDGLIAKVEFYDDKNNQLGTDTCSDWDWALDGSATHICSGRYDSPTEGRVFKHAQPCAARYKSAWKNPPVGDRTLTAKITDVLGGVTFSAVKFKMEQRLVQPPNLVTVSEPRDGAIYKSNQVKFNWYATVSDADGTISKVDYYKSVNGGEWTLHASSDVRRPFLQLEKNGALFLVDPPNTVRKLNVWIDSLDVGTYSLKVVATDNHGASSTSAPVQILVEPAGPDK